MALSQVDNIITRVRTEGVDQYTADITKASQATQQMGTAQERLASGSKALVGGLQGVAALGIGAGITAMMKSFAQAAMEEERLTARMIGITGSWEKSRQVIERMHKLARVLPWSHDELAEGYRQIEFLNVGLGNTEEQLKRISGAAIMAGFDLNSAIMVLARAKEGMYMARGALPLGLGPSVLEQYGVRFNGRTPTNPEMLLPAMTKALDKWTQVNEKVMETTGGAIHKYDEAMQELKEALGNSLAPAIKLLAGKITELTDKIAGAEPGIPRGLTGAGIGIAGISSLAGLTMLGRLFPGGAGATAGGAASLALKFLGPAAAAGAIGADFLKFLTPVESGEKPEMPTMRNALRDLLWKGAVPGAIFGPMGSLIGAGAVAAAGIPQTYLQGNRNQEIYLQQIMKAAETRYYEGEKKRMDEKSKRDAEAFAAAEKARKEMDKQAEDLRIMSQFNTAIMEAGDDESRTAQQRLDNKLKEREWTLQQLKLNERAYSLAEGAEDQDERRNKLMEQRRTLAIDLVRQETAMAKIGRDEAERIKKEQEEQAQKRKEEIEAQRTIRTNYIGAKEQYLSNIKMLGEAGLISDQQQKQATEGMQKSLWRLYGGEYSWAEQHGDFSGMASAQGKIIGIISSNALEQKKKVEEARKQREAMFKALFGSGAMGEGLAGKGGNLMPELQQIAVNAPAGFSEMLPSKAYLDRLPGGDKRPRYAQINVYGADKNQILSVIARYLDQEMDWEGKAYTVGGASG